MNKLTLEKVTEHQIVAIIRGVAYEHMNELFNALYDGGIRIAEITLNTENALHSIAHMRQQYGDRMWVGAGSVLNQDQAREAIAAGAQFLVSPNVDEGMITYALTQNIMPMPGAMTPTEIVAAVNFGAPLVKLFPTTSLGVGYVKELQGPLGHIPMLAVGGINADNVAAFLQAGIRGVGVGSNLVNKEWIKTGRFDLITAAARNLKENMNSN